jgi:hypothetical protein
MGPGWWQASDGRFYPPEATPGSPLPPPPQGHAPYSSGVYGPQYPSMGPVGRPERIGVQILLSVVTFGLYGIYWAYKCHEEVKEHTGDGIGGPFGALIYVVAGVVTLFLLPIEIERMYERDGRRSPVSAATAFWILLFGIPWYVKCQQALNEYWIAKGASPP